MKYGYTFLPADKDGKPIHAIHDDQGNFIRWGFDDGACVGPSESLDEAVQKFIDLKGRPIEPCYPSQAVFVAWKVTGPSAAQYFHFRWK